MFPWLQVPPFQTNVSSSASQCHAYIVGFLWASQGRYHLSYRWEWGWPVTRPRSLIEHQSRCCRSPLHLLFPVLAQLTFNGALGGEGEESTVCSSLPAADLEGATINAVFVWYSTWLLVSAGGRASTGVARPGGLRAPPWKVGWDGAPGPGSGLQACGL